MPVTADLAVAMLMQVTATARVSDRWFWSGEGNGRGAIESRHKPFRHEG